VVAVRVVVTGVAALLFFLLGAIWTPAFFLVSLFFGAVSGLSAYIAMVKLEERERHITHVMTDSSKGHAKAKELYG
jgi:hypothetical protein